MMEIRFSDRCPDLTKYWDRQRRICVPCKRKPGHEVNPNCGFDDDGGIHTTPFRNCQTNTFNDGTLARCQNCSPCPGGSSVLKSCTLTSDTICQERGKELTTVAFSEFATTHAATSFSTAATEFSTTHATTSFSTAATTRTNTADVNLGKGSPQITALWVVPITIIFFVMLAAAVCALKLKKRRGLFKSVCYKRRTSYKNEGFAPIACSGTNSEETEDILNAKILSAPLHTVLDDLDVLEDLVILLDPDTQGIKSTKHLASYCSFPSTWITYTYSMKDSKSPLKAVLEGVTSRQPDWTVGHLVNLLRQMDRNDAIAVLAKLRHDPHVGCM